MCIVFYLLVLSLSGWSIPFSASFSNTLFLFPMHPPNYMLFPPLLQYSPPFFVVVVHMVVLLLVLFCRALIYILVCCRLRCTCGRDRVLFFCLFFFIVMPPPPISTLFPHSTLLLSHTPRTPRVSLICSPPLSCRPSQSVL